MTDGYQYGEAEDDELLALARLENLAFGGDLEGMRSWLASCREGVRVLRHRGEIVGGLLLIDMGQFFGGRRVPMTGVAGVAVAPHLRGHGVATRLMHAAVAELARRGVALSTLYPATQPLYRRAGYELAGSRHRIRVRARDLAATERGLTIRPVQDTDAAAIRALYRGHAQARPGWLDRGDYVWRRVRRNRLDIEVHGYLVLSGHRPEGYVFYWQSPLDGLGYDLQITDMVARTPRATHRLLAFLASHRSMVRHVIWYGAVDDPLLYLLPERGYEVELHEHWMLRIADVAQALGERGYPAGLRARLELQVTDDVIRGNQGRYIVDVADGRAEVRRGGRGSLKLHVRALATLYAGFTSPQQLAAVGAVQGSAETLARAAAVFAGPAPSLPDFF